ncbi:MAG TPA: DMT family transporter [Levilinea sp.]|nr:DMT family transporter [Levilinea sp.]
MSIKEWTKFGVLSLLWGSSFLWIKIVIAETGPFTLVTFRVLLAVSGVLVIVLWRRPAWPGPAFLPVFLVLGLINTALPFTLISFSEQYISSGMASILNSTVPLFTIMIAPIFVRDDPFTVPKAIGLLVGFAGIVILVSDHLRDGFNEQMVGLGAMLLAAFFYAASGVYARRTTQGLTPEVQTLGQLVMALLIITPAAFVVEAPFTPPALPISWVALSWLGLLGTAAGTLIYYSLLHSIGPTRTLSVTYLFPLVGVLLGALFLGEHVAWQHAVGGGLIISGVWIVNQTKGSLRVLPAALHDRIISGNKPHTGKLHE